MKRSAIAVDTTHCSGRSWMTLGLCRFLPNSVGGLEVARYTCGPFEHCLFILRAPPSAPTSTMRPGEWRAICSLVGVLLVHETGKERRAPAGPPPFLGEIRR